MIQLRKNENVAEIIICKLKIQKPIYFQPYLVDYFIFQFNNTLQLTS